MACSSARPRAGPSAWPTAIARFSATTGSAAVGIALVNAIGNVAGFVGPNVVGFLRTHTGGDSGAFLTLAAFALVAAAICLGMRGKVPRPDHLAASS